MILVAQRWKHNLGGFFSISLASGKISLQNILLLSAIKGEKEKDKND